MDLSRITIQFSNVADLKSDYKEKIYKLIFKRFNLKISLKNDFK